MADEEKTDQNEEKNEQAEAEAPVEDAPNEPNPPEEAPDTPAGEAEEVADDAAPADDAPPADDAMEGMDWKARKRLLKSRESGEAGPQRSVEERAAERAAKQSTAAKARSSYRRKAREKREKGEGTAPVARESAGRKSRQGRVVSNKADKTITVRIDVARRHPAYEKIVRTSNKLHAHDEQNVAGEGDLVRIVETRPLSRSKRWRLVEVLEKAE
jgi:small subunit ribosomal protein S17